MRTLLFLLVAASFACMQPAEAQLLRGYGVKTGLTASNIYSPGLAIDTDRRLGLGLFAFTEWEWREEAPFSAVLEVGYIQRGFTQSIQCRDAQNVPCGSIRFAERIDYLSIATHAKFRFDGKRLKPYLAGGPRLDLIIGSDAQWSRSPLNRPGPEDPGEGDLDPSSTLGPLFSDTALGATLGAGVESRWGPVSVFMEGRYSMDLTNSLPDVPRDAYNNAFDLLFGVRF